VEKIGQVNRYVCRSCRRATWTVNLNSGTTPFGIRCPACGTDDSLSSIYRVGRAVYDLGGVTVTHGFYRPTPGRLAELNAELQARFPDAGPDGWDDHVLNGGLVLAPLGECRPVPEPEPPYPEHDGHAVFRAFILRLYGRALARP
jgi:DNA-directed RNA polymerase subunit RPC12/RpoP